MTAKQKAINAAFALWKAYEENYSVGRGTLHGVLDDGNLEDATLDAYIADFCAAIPLLSRLRGLPYKDRFEIYEYASIQRGQRADAAFEAQMSGLDALEQEINDRLILRRNEAEKS